MCFGCTSGTSAFENIFMENEPDASKMKAHSSDFSMKKVEKG
jgi:hypothetical protein